jgi:hypothetical protein
VVALHNFGPDPVEVAVELGDGADGRMLEVVGDQAYEPAKPGEPLALEGFGYRWLRLT